MVFANLDSFLYIRVYTNLENREKSGNFKGQGKTGKSQGIL
jgi:hypothetical protein